MITYYLIGNWMGSFRTKSTTETLTQFKEWATKHNVNPNSNKIWKLPDNGRVVFTAIDDESAKELNYPHIGL